MAIRVEHGRIADVGRLATLAGQSIAAQKEIEYSRAMARQLQQMEHEKEMTVFRAQLDLQASMRSQQWELEKMEIRSRVDFEREERERVRNLDSIDNALRQIDKEVESGRYDENSERIQNLRFYYKMKRQGTAPPVSLIQPPREERERYISPAQRMAAYKQLQTEELREPTWLERLLPGGKGELTEEELFYREMFEKTARGEPAGTITSPITTDTDIEPTSETEFYGIVSRLKAIDPVKARAYYNKWAGRF